jgi:two-component system nitrogen regulation response regulator GlnG
VAGTADTAASGFEAVARLKPDALLLDVRLPDGSGLDLCELLTREEGAPAVLLVSSDEAADCALATARGARGYVAKVDLWKVDQGEIWGLGEAAGQSVPQGLSITKRQVPSG